MNDRVLYLAQLAAAVVIILVAAALVSFGHPPPELWGGMVGIGAATLPTAPGALLARATGQATGTPPSPVESFQIPAEPVAGGVP